MRLPIMFSIDEVERLHSIAYAAAIQTGAKGDELDSVTADVFRALAQQANRAEQRARERPNLQLVME